MQSSRVFKMLVRRVLTNIIRKQEAQYYVFSQYILYILLYIMV